MCKLVLNKNSLFEYTSVSNIFIDEYMCKANGEFVKIYLYLLRMVNSKEHNSPLSTEMIADQFSLMESDVYRGLNYWSDEGLINLTYSDEGKLTGIMFNNFVKQTAMSSTILHQDEYLDRAPLAKVSGDSNATAPVSTSFIVPKKVTYSPTQLATFKQDDKISDLLFYVEAIIGRPLNSSDINSIIYMAKDLNMDIDFVEYMISKLIDKGVKTIPRIEKEMVKLASNGIFNKADYKKDEIVKSNIFKAIYKVFGLEDATPAKHDVELVQKWCDEFKYGEEMIIEACNRTMSKIHKGSFEYADSILTNWFNHNAKTMADIGPIDEAHAKKQNERFKAIAKASEEKSSSGKKSSGKTYRRPGKPELESHSYDLDSLEKLKNQS